MTEFRRFELVFTADTSEHWETSYQRVLDALTHSSNFTEHHEVIKLVHNASLRIADLDHDSENIYITCTECEHCEEQPVDQQRHHLQTFGLIKWLDSENDVERSLMECSSCGQMFVQNWNYKKDEELEEMEWSYACTSHVIWGDFDCGTVWAKTREEAIIKAKKEVSDRLEEINKRLKGVTTLEVDLSCLEVHMEN
jgi:hypothetical protein